MDVLKIKAGAIAPATPSLRPLLLKMVGTVCGVQQFVKRKEKKREREKAGWLYDNIFVDGF